VERRASTNWLFVFVSEPLALACCGKRSPNRYCCRYSEARVGIFLAYFATDALIRLFASGRFITGLPVNFETLKSPDLRVVLFTGAIALLTGLLCGVAPAVRASNTTPASALQPGSKIGETKRQRLFGKGLVASQVALSLVLVSLAALFVGYLSASSEQSGIRAQESTIGHARFREERL